MRDPVGSRLLTEHFRWVSSQNEDSTRIPWGGLPASSFPGRSQRAGCSRSSGPIALMGDTRWCQLPLGASPWRESVTMISSRRPSKWLNASRSRSRTLTLVRTRAPASRQIRAITHSIGHPRWPKIPALKHANRWCPGQSSGRPPGTSVLGDRKAQSAEKKQREGLRCEGGLPERHITWRSSDYAKRRSSSSNREITASKAEY